jgi:predicted dithiol-disulfide oxidoreductase (DUF899 family)
MRYSETRERLDDFRKRIGEIRGEMRALQKSTEPEEVRDYDLLRPDGSKVRLSALFGAHDTLFVIHNMGRSCPYCTLWADGFNGVNDHLQNRAAFVLSSPDEPAVQKEFAASRGWRFPTVSHKGTSFAADMGYVRDGAFGPGVSVFRKKDGKILRVSDTGFGPDDDFCIVWHFFDLLPEGADGWAPKYAYRQQMAGQAEKAG